MKDAQNQTNLKQFQKQIFWGGDFTKASLFPRLFVRLMAHATASPTHTPTPAVRYAGLS